MPRHAYEVAGVDVADLPDMHGLQVVGQEFRFRRGTGAAGRFQPVERPCLPAFVAAWRVPGVFFFRRLHEREFAGHAGIDDPHEVGVHFPQFLDHLLGKGDGRAVLEFQPFPSGEGALQVQDLEAAIHEFGGAFLVAVEGAGYPARFRSGHGRKRRNRRESI